MLVAQGADLEAFNRKLTRNHTAPVVLEIKSEGSGFVSKCDARIIGALMDAVKTCSLGQISRALYQVGGQYRRNM